MNCKRLLFLVLLFSFGLLNAQTDFRPGYVIKSPGDTLFGEVDYRGDFLMDTICRFRSDKKTINAYLPKDIIAYRIIDSKYYVSREVNGKRVFLEYLIKGKVSMYYMRDENGDHYFLDKDGAQLTEIPYKEEIMYNDGDPKFYKSTKHIGVLTYFMQDAPGFQSRIAEIKQPEHRNLIRLAEDYHNKVCSGEKCIIFEKNQPFLKVNIEVVGGIVNYANIVDLNDKNYLQTGLLLHLWMPRTNEKLYFKTGLLYSQVEDIKSAKYNKAKVPLHIEYIAPNTYRLRPSISIGLTSPSYSGGLMVRINKRINVGVQGWVNFFYDNIPWFPSELYNYSLLGNLYIEL